MRPSRLKSIIFGNNLLFVYTYQLCLSSGFGTDKISVQSRLNVGFLSITYLLAYLLTPWRRALLERLRGSQLIKKFPNFMEPEGSLPHSQVPAT